ncbi:MAG: glucose-1-phosphate thymidylyltransferase RfbA [Bacillota bacterium]
MKAIILAGGIGSRLYPATGALNKQLLPVYDKPMIYYPLATLMQGGLRDVLIISGKEDIPRFRQILEDGQKIGMNISYAIEEKPEGIAKALIIGENFIGKDSVCLALGDNLFYGSNLSRILQRAAYLKEGALVFAYWVNDPQRFGVVEFNRQGKVLSLEEKPKRPKSNYIVPGLYFYDNTVVDIVKQLKPSSRGEWEITDVNAEYLKQGRLRAEVLSRNIVWMDTGTPLSLLHAGNFVAFIEKRTGRKIACIEEIAWRLGLITPDKFQKLVFSLPKGPYREYLLFLLEQDKQPFAEAEKL